MTIEVVPYDAEWARTYARIRDELVAALAGVPLIGVEHVGSTAVPGLAAKPVIDVDVIVLRPHVGSAIRALRAGGYTLRGNLGIPDRYAMAEPDPPRRNVYVVVDGSLALRNHLAVRDVLRADAALRERYGRLKERLAAELDDVDRYVEGKSELLSEILSSAGFTGAELDAIRSANRSPR